MKIRISLKDILKDKEMETKEASDIFNTVVVKPVFIPG